MTGYSRQNEKEASEEYAVSLNGKRKAGHHQQDA